MAVGEDYEAALRAAGVIYYPIFTPNFRPLKRQFVFRSINLSTAAFAAQVRLTPDAGGSPLLTLTCAAVLSGADTWLTISATKAEIESLPSAPELGRNPQYYWDCNMTPSGDVMRAVFAGEFVRNAGVTQ